MFKTTGFSAQKKRTSNQRKMRGVPIYLSYLSQGSQFFQTDSQSITSPEKPSSSKFLLAIGCPCLHHQVEVKTFRSSSKKLLLFAIFFRKKNRYRLLLNTVFRSKAKSSQLLVTQLIIIYEVLEGIKDHQKSPTINFTIKKYSECKLNLHSIILWQ